MEQHDQQLHVTPLGIESWLARGVNGSKKESLILLACSYINT